MLATISAGPIFNVYKARARAAATEVGELISQCKINNLSGMPNELELRYDDTEEVYRCELYHLDKDGNRESSEPYKSEKIGNSRLEIFIDSDENSIKSHPMTVRFNTKTGAVKELKYNGLDIKDFSHNIISFASNNVFISTLYSKTGEQIVEMSEHSQNT